MQLITSKCERNIKHGESRLQAGRGKPDESHLYAGTSKHNESRLQAGRGKHDESRLQVAMGLTKLNELFYRKCNPKLYTNVYI